METDAGMGGTRPAAGKQGAPRSWRSQDCPLQSPEGVALGHVAVISLASGRREDAFLLFAASGVR